MLTYVARVRGLVVVVLALVACNPQPHVQLGPLPPNLPPMRRVQLFNDLHATFERTTETTSCSNRGGCSTSVQRTLYLANGTQVHHPEDILPVVAPDSAAARSVRTVQNAQSKRRIFTIIAVAGVIVGAISVKTAFDNEEVDFSGGTKLGLIGGGLAFLVGSIGGYYYYAEATDAHGEANVQYNDGLARALDVCVRGLDVVACEAQSSPSTLAPPGGL